MDHQTFDRLTRLFGIAGSRRTAWQALLGAALLGATTRSVAAAPTSACDAGGQESCGIGGPCCPGRCFVTCRATDSGTSEPTTYEEFALCCTGKDLIICGKECCLDDGRDDPCERCELPSEPGMPTGAQVCIGAIAGSYRRR
jgi:hypothetical protein